MLDQILAIALQFQKDFNVQADVDFELKPSVKMVTVDDPKGKRPAHGSCSPLTDKVYINKDHWQRINSWQKKELVYHELGHCVFELRHVSEKNRIMNSFSPRTYWVNKDGGNWPALVNKLKTYIREED